MRVLFVAYYFDPFPGVGAKRISYWARNIKACDGRVTCVDVITATAQDTGTNSGSAIDNIFHVKPSETSWFGRIFAYDKGAAWLPALKRFIRTEIAPGYYDYAVVTGNPFLYFGVTSVLQKAGTRTILDFRDPFATNPRAAKKRTAKSWVKGHINWFLEASYIRNAWKVVTVNRFCASLLAGSEKRDIEIIDNGFDEAVVGTLAPGSQSQGDALDIVYAGSLYRDRNPLALLEALRVDNGYSFHHVGPKADLLEEHSTLVTEHGTKSYRESLELIGACDIGVIFTAGDPFESTTKIFDYIALNRVILIITAGEPETGAMHEITREYGKVFWSRNTVADVINVLQHMREASEVFAETVDVSRFSRKRGLEKLVALLD